MSTARRVTASAPGKAILVGEHAAVYGVPALVAGVGLRLEAEVSPTEGAGSVDFELPDLDHRETRGWSELLAEAETARAQWIAWRDGDAPLPEVALAERAGRVVRLALAEAELALMEQGRGLARTGGLRLRVRSELPLGSGLGSSAAVAVTVVAAALRCAGVEPSSSFVQQVAGEVERRQHGSPSGVDVAAVLRGGVIRAVREDDGSVSCTPQAPTSTALSEVRLFHSGAPVESTGEVVSAVRSLRADQPELVEVAFAEIARAEEMLRRALAGERLLGAAFRRAHAALVTLGVVPAAVQEAVARLEESGGAAKISGAGSLSGPGAGLVVAVVPSEVVVPWTPLETELGAPGLDVRAD